MQCADTALTTAMRHTPRPSPYWAYVIEAQLTVQQAVTMSYLPASGQYEAINDRDKFEKELVS